MNKQEFINFIADRYDMDKRKAEAIIDTFVDATIAATFEGKEVSLIGFGQFHISEVPARTAMNPASGDAVHVPAHKAIRFKVGQKLKDAVNGKGK